MAWYDYTGPGQMAKALEPGWDWLKGDEAPAVPGLPTDELQRRNLALADTMGARVRGEGTSPAELQMRAGLDRQRAMAESLAHSGAGAYNPGLARRQALRAQGEAGAQFNADAGILRAQEQAAAEGRLAGLLGQDKQINFARDMGQWQSDRDLRAGVVDTVGEFASLLKPKLAGGGIVDEPTEALIGEGGRPEAVVPLTSPADAALAARMIEKARMRMDAEQKARALAMMATRLTGGGKVHRASAASLDAASDYGARMGALAARLTEGR